MPCENWTSSPRSPNAVVPTQLPSQDSDDGDVRGCKIKFRLNPFELRPNSALDWRATESRCVLRKACTFLGCRQAGTSLSQLFSQDYEYCLDTRNKVDFHDRMAARALEVTLGQGTLPFILTHTNMPRSVLQHQQKGLHRSQKGSEEPGESLFTVLYT